MTTKPQSDKPARDHRTQGMRITGAANRFDDRCRRQKAGIGTRGAILDNHGIPLPRFEFRLDEAQAGADSALVDGTLEVRS
ncbi:hypothetical protein [Mycolicibacterium aubagnense]|uniref:hypothetical protein n=1 Tax=Mycolicibacterium aubagnense TaxID=319707 RepID=UPI0010FD2E21|nr:hypothetical protein [Mycolicibacterium aubagnense]TLH65630.1 hypothetical protein C1S80_09670 [Mycolicibacterium aubagnense]WGI31213.1 hypothetical protein QDT91_18380 [Mycolicibacterium aubagnense]